MTNMEITDNDNYGETLRKTKRLHAKLADAHKRSDWPAIGGIVKEIGKLYAPNDVCAAGIIAYLVDTSFTRGWFDSVENQIEKRYRRDMEAYK